MDEDVSSFSPVCSSTETITTFSFFSDRSASSGPRGRVREMDGGEESQGAPIHKHKVGTYTHGHLVKTLNKHTQGSIELCIISL